MNSSPESLLIPDIAAAALCGCSRSHWHALAAAGKVPPSVKLGRKRLWRRGDVLLFIEWGCPGRAEFEARKAALGRRTKVVD